jgi:hypothetical protein
MPETKMIWKGALHIGDEPGIFGDSAYVGLTCELPFTLYRFTEKGSDLVRFLVETSQVRTFHTYPGHEVTLTAFEPPARAGEHWTERRIGDVHRLKSDGPTPMAIDADLADVKGKRLFLSLRVRVDTSVPAGLFDDFEILRLSFVTVDHRFYSSFGFDAADR